MPHAMLEHINLTVRDPDATAALLGALFDWKVRWAGPSIHGGRTVHTGTQDQYLAVYSMPGTTKAGGTSYARLGGLNHIGIAVEDLDATEQRILAAGFKTFNHSDHTPGRRFYFHDADGIEFEVLSYAEQSCRPPAADRTPP